MVKKINKRATAEIARIERDGESMNARLHPRSWHEYLNGAARFTDDYPDRIDDPPPQERDPF
jgi:hypothetical protein